MKHFKGLLVGFVLAFILSQATVSNAQALPPPPKGETPITIPAAHILISGSLTLTGNAQGQAVLTNSQNGSSQTFQADTGKWVREVFLLDGGKTVGASQADHTVFWNVATGQQTGRIEARVYGFSHNQKLCFTAMRSGSMQIFAYPSLQLAGTLSTGPRYGVNAFVFSPDDHYLLVEEQPSRPETEKVYPNGAFVFHLRGHVELYDLAQMQPVTEFNNQVITAICPFTPDSQFIYLGIVPTLLRTFGQVNTNWQFDLMARTFVPAP